MEEPRTGAGALYQALMRHFVHQDRIVYQSLPYLSAIQTATIAGSWAIASTHPRLAVLIAFLGAVLTFYYLHYVRAARADRDANKEIMQKLGAELIDQTSAKGLRLRLDACPMGRFRGVRVVTALKAMIVLFIVFDILIGVSFIIGWLP